MSKLIKDNAIVDNTWVLLEASETPEAVEVADGSIVPLAVWKAQKDQLEGRKGSLGVWLNSDELAEELAEEANGFGLVAVNFPGFMDGRGFSAARLLRERYGYQGELRAVGHIIRDQLFFLKRCGFSSYDLGDVNLEDAMASFGDFSETYQAAVDQKLPLFRRRA